MKVALGENRKIEGYFTVDLYGEPDLIHDINAVYLFPIILWMKLELYTWLNISMTWLSSLKRCIGYVRMEQQYT